ncbi:hypothetical protein CLOM_g10965 [Closterium sp. NIES-68]|nr:hypothetical protein CLOM_g10965 [Closterium sp. NIES-68]GJP86007.1 hypothetical protein CLOP_g16077 [Closterium sp. NIES-67]
MSKPRSSEQLAMLGKAQIPAGLAGSSPSPSPVEHSLILSEEKREVDGDCGGSDDDVESEEDDVYVGHRHRKPRPSILSGRLGTFAAMAMAVAFFSVVLGFALSIFLTAHLHASCSSAFDGGGGLPPAPSGVLGGQPTVILVSLDGFRHGYHLKADTPNLNRLLAEGTFAEHGMLPVFPSLTFPSHYSMATGLLPASHGIIANKFRNPANHSDVFTPATIDPRWWLGEPIWATVNRQGLRAATVFWPGADVSRADWSCPSDYCLQYNESMPFEQRVDQVLAWLDLPSPLRPSFLSLYFEEPDESGHKGGPDTPLVSAAVKQVDSMIGRLLGGLDARNMTNDVNLIVVSDHGMLATCKSRVISLEQFEPHVPGLSPAWIDFSYPLLGIFLPETDAQRRPGTAERVTQDPLASEKLERDAAAAVVAGMRRAIEDGQIANGDALSIYLREDFPAQFEFSGSDRIPPILALAAEGYSVVYHHSSAWDGGMHGYDNTLASMRSVFMARGPRFAAHRRVPTFRNTELHNVISSILKIEPAPNNGSSSFPDTILV